MYFYRFNNYLLDIGDVIRHTQYSFEQIFTCPDENRTQDCQIKERKRLPFDEVNNYFVLCELTRMKLAEGISVYRQIYSHASMDCNLLGERI